MFPGVILMLIIFGQNKCGDLNTTGKGGDLPPLLA